MARRFLLRPSDEVNRILIYLLALYASRHGVLLHAFALLSTHLHLMKTDVKADMPGFMRDLNSQTTKRMNRLLQREGSLWDARKYGNVEVHGEHAAWDKLVYVMTNPVKHAWVEEPAEWPGLLTTVEDFRRGEVVVERPDLECFKGSTLPKRVQLELVPPPALAHLPREEFLAELERRVSERVAELRAGLRPPQRSCLGRRAVLQASREGRLRRPLEHSDVDPRISRLDEDPDRCAELIRELQARRAAYAEARGPWRQGEHAVVFPQGTYAYRVLRGTRSAGADPPG